LGKLTLPGILQLPFGSKIGPIPKSPNIHNSVKLLLNGYALNVLD
jgi:hypothetical protein